MSKTQDQTRRLASKNASSSAAGTAFPVLSDAAQDLTSLATSLGPPDETFRRVLFRNTTETDFYDWGVRADSGDLLADMPRFISSSLRILAALDPPRRKLVRLPPPIFAILVAEARTLETLHAGHRTVATTEAGDKADRETKLKRVSSEGVSLRNALLASLRSAVGDPRLDKVRKAASDASTPNTLVTGLEAVATFIDDTFTKGTDDDRTALAAFQTGPEAAQELRAKAAEITAASTVTAVTGKRVSKRTLDLQDGRVLVLVDMIVRAFRHAVRADKSILKPELNRIAHLFDSGSTPGKEAAPAGGQPSPPVS